MDRMKGFFRLMESIELAREDKRGNGRYYRRRVRVFPTHTYSQKESVQ